MAETTSLLGSEVIAVLFSVMSGAPVLFAHTFAAASVVLMGLTGYVWATPHQEIRLVRGGNTAAALALAATILGVVLPGAVCLKTGVNLADVVIWTVVAVLFQLAVFRVADLVFRDLAERIEQGELGAAAVLSASKLGAGILLASGLG